MFRFLILFFNSGAHKDNIQFRRLRGYKDAKCSWFCCIYFMDTVKIKSEHAKGAGNFLNMGSNVFTQQFFGAHGNE